MTISVIFMLGPKVLNVITLTTKSSRDFLKKNYLTYTRRTIFRRKRGYFTSLLKSLRLISLTLKDIEREHPINI